MSSWESGGWLFHCHVLEHSGKGMLSVYEVHEPDEVYRFLGRGLNGSRGKVSLTAVGDLAAGEPPVLTVVDALPGARVELVGQHRVAGGGRRAPARRDVGVLGDVERVEAALFGLGAAQHMG